MSLTKNIFSYLKGLAGGPQSLKRRLIFGGLGIAFIQGLTRVLALLLSMFLARTLGSKGYGIYAYAFAIVTFLMIFSQAGLPNLLVREVAALDVSKKWDRLRGLLIRALQLNITASAILLLVAAFILYSLRTKLDPQYFKTYVFALTLLPVFALTRTAASTLSGLQHVVKAMMMESVIRPALVLATVCALFTLYPFTRLPSYAMAAQLVGAIIVLFAIWLMVYRHLPQEVSQVPAAYETRKWLSSALAFAMMDGAGLLNSQADILLLGMFRSPSDVGLYRVATQGAALVAFGLISANAVIAPQFARLYAKNDMPKLQKLVTASARVILLVAMPVALLLVFAGDKIILLLFGPDFVKSHTPLAILALGQLVNAAMGSVGYLLNMTGHEKDVTRTLFITAGLNFLANLILIPFYGIIGAAIATACTTTLWNLLLYRLVKRRIGINSTAFAWKTAWTNEET